MIEAKRKDGTPARTGDHVLVVWDNGMRLFGKIKSLEKVMRFSANKNVPLMTYQIRCKDGCVRPAHAWHIKYINPKCNNQRKR